jgi:DNA-directed RNA polymerase specialized sigma24 family protein
MNKSKLSFEDCYETIIKEINKKKYKWTLSSLSWLGWDDISQIILIHIHDKWSQYNQDKPLLPWLNALISNQIKNIVRNNYSNYARPCLKCKAAEPNDGCKIYETQCSTCPAFEVWEKRRKSAYDVKLPVSIENHTNEVHELSEQHFTLERNIESVHKKMREVLKPLEFKVYEGLFILNESEEALAKRLGYISNEKNRAPGYKQIKNIRKIIILKVKKCMQSGELDIY